MTARQNRWLVALDIDGTVLHEDETLSPHVVAAIARAVAAGHEVMLATGRSWSATLPVLQLLDLTPEYVVCANGAVILKRDASETEGYRRAHVETFDPRPVLNRIRAALPEGKFMVEDAAGRRFYTEGMYDWNLNGADQVEFEELGFVESTRVVCVSPQHSVEEFLDIVAAMGLHQVSYAIGYTAWLDIAPEGVNKATALERVREWLGIPLHRVFAAGDGRNDIEMLEWAAQSGRAIAMGQAPDIVRELATEIVADVVDDGLVSALDSLIVAAQHSPRAL